MRYQRLILLVAGLLSLFSCEHRPLTDINTGHYIRVYVDDDIRNITYGLYNGQLELPEYTQPKALRVIVSDPDTDAIIAERFLQKQGTDDRGHYFEGHISIPAGEYNLMAYSFGSVVTLLKNENSFYTMTAYTASLSDRHLQYIPTLSLDMSKSRIVRTPEHIFCDVAQPIQVEESAIIDTLTTADGDFFYAKSKVKSYYMQVRVRGFEWIRTAVALLGGMRGSATMHTNDQSDTSDDVELFLTTNYANRERSNNGSTATLYTTFNTFGRSENAESHIISFEFILSDGSSQVEQIDITSLFDSDVAQDKQWLLIDKEIVITPTAGPGGMSPGVDDWEDVMTNIEM